MISAAEKAYKAYKKIVTKWKPFTNTTTSELNIIYNARCRFDKDEDFRRDVLALDIEEEDILPNLIDKFFNAYNNHHGVDIRNTLVEIDDTSLASGTYFIIRTYLGECEVSPISFKAGDSAKVEATLYSYETDEPVSAPEIFVDLVGDGNLRFSKSEKNSSSLTFDLIIPEPGYARFKVFARDENEKNILGSEVGYGGVVFSIDEIMPTHKQPKDFIDFWNEEIDKMMAADPLCKTADGYEGDVQYEYDMPKYNYYNIIKVDKDYLQRMRDNLLTCPKDEDLDIYDIYDVNLKAPGPCHSTAYIVIPRGAEPKSMPIHFLFDGYGVYNPEPVLNKSRITVHCSHHGYTLGMHSTDYYPYLNQTVCHYYGRGGKEINAGYKNPKDCYMTYLLVRDLLMVWFATTPKLCRDLYGLSEAFSGEIIISGGSMGGYQSLCIGGLARLLSERTKTFVTKYIEPNIPAFCNIAGHTEGRVKTYINTYEDGVDYYDAAHFAPLINCQVKIPRIGLGDDTCPAGGIIAAFNALPKDILAQANFLQNSSHGFIPDERFQRWYKYNNN